MSYQAGFLNSIIIPLNRKKAVVGKLGIDGTGIEWKEEMPLHANVDFTRGKSGMNVGSLDVYSVKIVRMRWNNIINERSRIKYKDKIYQILPETFHAQLRENQIQFHMQLVINDENEEPEPEPSSSEV